MKTIRLVFAVPVLASLLATGAMFARDVSGQFREGVDRQVTQGTLKRDYPARKSSAVSRATKSADAIVGWYDKGHHYHAQKMGQRFTPKEKYLERMRMRGRSVQ